MDVGDAPVVVVGTTPDYVARIHGAYPGRAFFVTDRRFRGHPDLERVPSSVLMWSDLEDLRGTVDAVSRRLAASGFGAAGVACFDCESLLTASRVARALGVRGLDPDAVTRARNKFVSRRLWRDAGVACPHVALATGREDTLSFLRRAGRSVVVKPLTASGSELLFLCADEEEVVSCAAVMERELALRPAQGLFRVPPSTDAGDPVDPRRVWVVEEYVPGPEFSCDFLLDAGCVTILRETGKVKAPGRPFGSVCAYTCPPAYPDGFSTSRLTQVLSKAATALGFTWGHFMVDYIIRDREPVLIETTPRPGGDAIPDLVESACGCDLIGMHLDIVSGRFRPCVPARPCRHLASIRLYCTEEGVVTELDASGLERLDRVRKVTLTRRPGDRVVLPPRDYDSRLLGHCIVEMTDEEELPAVADTLTRALRVSVSRP